MHTEILGVGLRTSRWNFVQMDSLLMEGTIKHFGGAKTKPVSLCLYIEFIP